LVEEGGAGWIVGGAGCWAHGLWTARSWLIKKAPAPFIATSSAFTEPAAAEEEAAAAAAAGLRA
jgi:hypothetical protein